MDSKYLLVSQTRHLEALHNVILAYKVAVTQRALRQTVIALSTHMGQILGQAEPLKLKAQGPIS